MTVLDTRLDAFTECIVEVEVVNTCGALIFDWIVCLTVSGCVHMANTIFDETAWLTHRALIFVNGVLGTVKNSPQYTYVSAEVVLVMTFETGLLIMTLDSTVFELFTSTVTASQSKMGFAINT